MITDDFIMKALKQEGFVFPDAVINNWRHYLNGILMWNKTYNLTSIIDPEAMLVKHLFDSIVLIPFLKNKQHARVIDVGTGAGLPGFILALAMPESHFVLLDSNSKRTRFMMQMKFELEVDNIEIIHSRVQDYKPRELFDIVLSRAFASGEDMVKWSSHLLAKQGCFAAMKGNVDESEWSFTFNEYQSEIVELHVPRLNEVRHLVFLS